MLLVHSFFHSAALVSIALLLHVMNVPEGRDEPLSEGEWDIGQEAAVGNGYVNLHPISPEHPSQPLTRHLPSLASVPQTSRSDGSGPSAGVSMLFLLSSPSSSFQTPSPGQSAVESRSVPLVNGGCVSELVRCKVTWLISRHPGFMQLTPRAPQRQRACGRQHGFSLVVTQPFLELSLAFSFSVSGWQTFVPSEQTWFSECVLFKGDVEEESICRWRSPVLSASCHFMATPGDAGSDLGVCAI